MISGEYVKALESLVTVPDWEKSRSSLYNMGLCKLKLNRVDEAIEHFN
jgi:hypothetical protein